MSWIDGFPTTIVRHTLINPLLRAQVVKNNATALGPDSQYPAGVVSIDHYENSDAARQARYNAVNWEDVREQAKEVAKADAAHINDPSAFAPATSDLQRTTDEVHGSIDYDAMIAAFNNEAEHRQESLHQEFAALDRGDWDSLLTSNDHESLDSLFTNDLFDFDSSHHEHAAADQLPSSYMDLGLSAFPFDA